MKDIGNHFGLTNSGNAPKEASGVLASLFQIQDPNNGIRGIMTTLHGLRNGIPNFNKIINDPDHAAHDQAQLLDRLIVSGLQRNVCKDTPTIQDELKSFFEENHNIRFAAAPSGVDYIYLREMMAVASKYPNKVCRELLFETALAATKGLDRNSKEGKALFNAIKPDLLELGASQMVRR